MPTVTRTWETESDDRFLGRLCGSRQPAVFLVKIGKTHVTYWRCHHKQFYGWSGESISGRAVGDVSGETLQAALISDIEYAA